MITEKNTILTEFTLTEELQKKFSHKLFVVSLILLIAGAVGLAVYFASVVYYIAFFDESPAWCEALLLFAIPFAFGLIMLITVRTQIKNAKKISGVKNVYEFYSDCLIAKEIRNGEQTAVVRIEYGKIVKTKDTPEVFYFYYVVKTLAYPINKAGLTAAEFGTVKKLFGCKINEGEEVLSLAPYAEAENAFKG